jgi:hypothetical protein
MPVKETLFSGSYRGETSQDKYFGIFIEDRSDRMNGHYYSSNILITRTLSQFALNAA